MKSVCVVATLALLCFACAASAIVTEQVSVSSSGVPKTGGIGNLSADGRYVVFLSSAEDVVPDDTNGVQDVFVHDRQTGITERVSVSSGDPGGQANGPSSEMSPIHDGIWEPPCISGNGRYVVFSSSATNLVGGDTNGVRDIFIRDRINKTTERVSVSSSGEQSNGISCYPSASADGTHAAFVSVATNLVSGDTNGAPDVFVRDLSSGNTYRVNLSSAGAQALGQETYSGHYIPDRDITARISGDGLHVAFASSATNLVSGDTNNTYDMFVRDLNPSNPGSGTTLRASVSTSGQQCNGFCWGGLSTISHDGSVVVFSSYASNLDEVIPDTNGQNDVFVRDRNAQTTRRVSLNWQGGQSNSQSNDPSCSPDGNKVTFHNHTDELLPGGDGLLNVYMVNKDGTGIERLGGDSTGAPRKGWDGLGSPSWDGRFVGIVNIPSSVPSFGDARGIVLDRAAVTIADAKRKANDQDVIVSGAAVTAVFDGVFYVEQDGIASNGRLAGIKVVWPGNVTDGKRYVVTGTMKANSDGERYIEATAVDPHTSEWTIDVKPLGMSSKILGGGDWRFDSATGAGQRGVTGGAGLNNIGLLVRTTGSCAYVDDHTFTIDDGSRVSVTCITPSTMLVNPAWQYVAVTGISSLRKVGETYERLLRVTSVDPIVSGFPEGITGRWETTLTTGDYGMLLVQEGSTVRGAFRGITITDGVMTGNVFTCSFPGGGGVGDLNMTFTWDGDALSGEIANVDRTFVLAVTCHRVSNEPFSPYVGRPQVVAASCDGSAIDITWDRPTNGVPDFYFTDEYGHYIGMNEDSIVVSYDPQTYAFHMILDPSVELEEGVVYTVHMDGPSGDPSWLDPYGAAAWDSVANACTFVFTLP